MTAWRTTIAAAFVVAIALSGAARAAESPAPDAAGGDALLAGISAMPGVVEDVRVAGNWQDGDKTGTYRIVVARTGGEVITARLFVQWIAYSDDGDANVDHTIEIKEFADLKADIGHLNAETETDGLAVFIDTAAPNGDQQQSFELFITSPTEYRFGPASN